ncbi:MAG TPA: hypothetical protein VHW44_26075 [Pseudonocardiaceae bacterium]|nr:hypothetical protein [Pseudonocardiaceae bacterium]
MTEPRERRTEPQPRPHRRGDDVFGDVLPDVTSDEREPQSGDDRDSWYLENRPPHHGG